jgi:hypothetical protein
MTTLRDQIYAGYLLLGRLISYVVWLYFRFRLSLRVAEVVLVAFVALWM